jgi:cation transport ATPase
LISLELSPPPPPLELVNSRTLELSLSFSPCFYYIPYLVLFLCFCFVVLSLLFVFSHLCDTIGISEVEDPEFADRILEYGVNVYPKPPRKGFWMFFLGWCSLAVCVYVCVCVCVCLLAHLCASRCYTCSRYSFALLCSALLFALILLFVHSPYAVLCVCVCVSVYLAVFFFFLAEAMNDPMIIILIVAAVISLVIGLAAPEEGEEATAWIEGAAIMVAVLAVGFITAINEYGQESQFRALNDKKNEKQVVVIREGHQIDVPIQELMVGDVIVLETGDQIPADGVLIIGHELTVDESVMTGEADSVTKGPENWKMLSGCKADGGNGRMLALAVGENSQWGITLKELSTKRPPTPLQEQLGVMAKLIGLVGLVVAVLVFIVLMIYWAIEVSSEEWEWGKLRDIVDFFIIAVTIVVVAVPEGLPLAVTISLAYSMKQMVRDNNLVRQMAACETMGGATNICSDKTGTLTENRMTCTEGFVLLGGVLVVLLFGLVWVGRSLSLS